MIIFLSVEVLIINAGYCNEKLAQEKLFGLAKKNTQVLQPRLKQFNVDYWAFPNSVQLG